MDRMDKIILHFLQNRSSKDELKEIDGWKSGDIEREGLLQNLKVWLLSGSQIDKKPKVNFQNTWKEIQKRESARTSFRTYLKYAAIIFVLINVGWWGATVFQGSIVFSGNQNYCVVANDHSNSIVLPDETVVYLRPGARLEYNSKFNSKHRNVSLNGEAYFEVFRDETSPFIIHTEEVDIKVLGTKFNVFAEKGSSIYQTTLVEGEVEVDVHNGQRYLLEPKQMLELDVKSHSVNIKEVDTNLYTAWKDGKMIFRDETLGEITKKLERIYHCKFIYNNEKLAESYKFSGAFYYETSLGDIITMLKISIPMEVKRVEQFPAPDIIYLK